MRLVHEVDLGVAEGCGAVGGPGGLREPRLVQARATVAHRNVDNALARGHDGEVVDGVRALVRVYVARKDGVDAVLDECRLVRPAHGLAVIGVRRVRVVPGRVQDDDDPRREGAVDGREVGVEPHSHGRPRAEAASVEGRKRHDVHGAGVIREELDAVSRALGNGHAGEAVLRGDGGDAVRLIPGRRVGMRKGCRERGTYSTLPLPPLTSGRGCR